MKKSLMILVLMAGIIMVTSILVNTSFVSAARDCGTYCQNCITPSACSDGASSSGGKCKWKDGGCRIDTVAPPVMGSERVSVGAQVNVGESLFTITKASGAKKGAFQMTSDDGKTTYTCTQTGERSGKASGLFAKRR